MQDVASGLAARVLPGLASVLVVPLLVHILGAQQYAAIGIFLTVQALSAVLDVGLATSISRQAAWLMGSNAAPREFGGLLHSFEIPNLSTAVVIVLTGALGGYAILGTAFHLDLASIGLDYTGAFFLFASIGVRFPFWLYFGYLSGRRFIQTANYIFLVAECSRIFGGLALMIWVAPNLSLFFAWQFLTGLFAAVVTAVAAYRITNPARVPPNWRGMMEIRGVLFGAGQMLLLFAIASSLDKFFLPRFVSAADYGIYVAIGQLAIGNFIVIYPIWAAFHPRLLAAIAANDARSIRQTFLSAAGVMIALCCAFIVGTMIATPAILHLWVGPRETGFELVLILVAAGYGLLAMSHLALTIHQAAGRYFPTPLIFAAAIVIVPTVGYLTLQRIDVNAVAALWMLIYAIEFLAGAFAFRLYAPQLLPLWLAYVVAPLIAALLAGELLSRWTHGLIISTQLALAVCCAILTALVIAVSNPAIRTWVRYHLAKQQA
jgi:O-antigen/teichoic acid export membrane protein